MDDLLTTKQLQELLKIDRTTVYRMLNDGRLTGIKVGGQWRFSRQEVEGQLTGARSAKSSAPTISTDVLPLRCVQAVQNVFAEIAGVGSVTTAPDGEPLTKISNSCRFCNLILASESGRQACVESWRKLAQQSESRPRFVTCHAGLQYARSRIEVGGTFTAMLIAGQFNDSAPDPEQLSQQVRLLAHKHGIDPDALAEAVQDIPVLDADKQEGIGGWLNTVAQTFEEIGHERAMLMNRLQQIAAMSTLNTE